MKYDAYLGDGVYAAFDGFQVWLSLNPYGSHESIALEPEVLVSLLRYGPVEELLKQQGIHIVQD